MMRNKRGNFLDTKCKKHFYPKMFTSKKANFLDTPCKKQGFLKNKKANFLDMFGLLEILAVIIFLGLFVMIILTAVSDGFVANAAIPVEATDGMVEVKDKYPMLLDMLFTGFLVAIFAFSIFAARLIPSSPKAIFVAFIFLIGGALFGKLIEQIWYPFTQHTFLASYINLMTIAPFVLNHFTMVIIIFITAVSIALLAKDEYIPQ